MISQSSRKARQYFKYSLEILLKIDLIMKFIIQTFGKRIFLFLNNIVIYEKIRKYL